MDKQGLTRWITRLRKALRREFEERAAPLEVTAAQFHVLRCLWQSDGLLTSALAREAASDGGTMTGVLDRLENKGWIRRERSPEDRRAVQIWLTPAGRALEEPLLEILTEINHLALQGLSAREQVRLMAVLEKIGHNLDA
jgi:DNA-binding MarR family transcriptional regulator